MKKLLIVLSAAALTLLATAATADAGHYVRYVCGYDRCGHPVYWSRYVPTYSSRTYCPPSYNRGRSSHNYRHNSYSYSRPSYNYSRGRSYGRSYCR